MLKKLITLLAVAGLVLALAPVGTAHADILAKYDFGDAVTAATTPSPLAELGATTLALGVVAGDITPGSVFADTTTINGFEVVVPHVINQATGGASGSSTVNGINYNFGSSGNNHYFAVTSNEDDPTAEDGGSATTMVIADQALLDLGGGSDRGGAFLNLGGRSSSYGATPGQAFTQGHSFSWTISASGGDLLISMLTAKHAYSMHWALAV